MSRAGAKWNEEFVQIDYPNFDIQSVINEYKGLSKIQRLMFIADRCPSARESAVKLLMQAAETKGKEAIKDNTLYREIYKYGKQYLDNSLEPDAAYIHKTTDANMVRRTKLEDDIQKWRNLTQRGNSRLAHLQSARFLSRLGEFELAMHKLSDAKEFAETPEEMIECQVQIIFTSVKQGSLSRVQYEATRMFTTYDKALTDTVRSQIHACMGLYYLKSEKFSMASTHFLQATRVSSFSEILSKRDLGIYGALCALGDLKRNQLKAELLDNVPFMAYLDRAPEVKKLVYAMTNSQYSLVMESLRSLKNDFLLDYYLHNVAEGLMNAVRGKALVQYFEPFSSMNLSRMAKDFGVGVAAIEEELYKAILNGQVKGKIDLANHTLLGHEEVTDRRAILRTIVDEGEAFCRDAAVVLCNLALTASKIELNKSQADEESGSGDPNNNKYRNLFGLRKGNRKGKLI